MQTTTKTKLKSRRLDIIVLCARSEEQGPIVEELEAVCDDVRTRDFRRIFRSPTGNIPTFAFLSKNNSENPPIYCGVVECAEMGNVSAAINTAFVICQHEPKLIIFSGIAGSLNCSRLRVGDVILPRRVKTRYFNKFKSFSEDYSSIPSSERTELIEHVKGKLHAYAHSVDVLNGGRNLLAHLRKAELESQIKNVDIPAEWVTSHSVCNQRTKVVLEEEIFCWDKVLSNKSYVNFLKTQLEGAWTTVDMESYGFLRAVEKLRSSNYATDGVVVRAVSDFAQHKELSDSDPKWRALGLKNMAITTRYLIDTVFERAYG